GCVISSRGKLFAVRRKRQRRHPALMAVKLPNNFSVSGVKHPDGIGHANLLIGPANGEEFAVRRKCQAACFGADRFDRQALFATGEFPKMNGIFAVKAALASAYQAPAVRRESDVLDIYY